MKQCGGVKRYNKKCVDIALVINITINVEHTE